MAETFEPDDMGPPRAMRGPGATRPPAEPREPKSAPQTEIPKPEGKPLSRDDLKLREAIKELYQGVAFMALPFAIARGDEPLSDTAVAMAENAERAADAWMALANKNSKVKKMLKQMTETSAVGALVMIHATMLAPLIAGRIKGRDSMAEPEMPVDPEYAAATANGLFETAVHPGWAEEADEYGDFAIPEFPEAPRG